MRKNFDRYLGHWRERKASSISNTDVEQLHGKLASDRGIYTANRTLQLLRAVFNKAIVWHLFDKENPTKGISLFQEQSRERFLTKEEATKLLRALELESNDDLRDFIKLSFFTGVRKANLMSIRWHWIDWESETLTIPDTKNNTKQVLSLGGLEVALLRNRLERLEDESENDGTTFSDYVFPGPGRDGHLRDLKRSWTTFRKKVGLEDVTIHDLRRHKDMKTTLSVYARTHQEAVRDARERALKPILQNAGLIEKKRRRNKAVSKAT